METLTQQEEIQYQRMLTMPQYGHEAQLKLKKAKILVIGAGGLGSAVLPSLAAAGVGTIGIVEFDQVSLSNLPRQLLYNPSEIGKSKLQLAAEKLKNQNPQVTINQHEKRFAQKNAEELLSCYDLAVDCSDNFATRYLLNDTCQALEKPLVYGSVHDVFGHVSLFHGRKKCSLRHLFPEPQNVKPASGILPHLPLFVGSLMVNEVIHFFTNTSQTLDGKLLTVNLQTLQMRKITLCP